MTVDTSVIFALNCALIIVDASLGYHLAPFLMHRSLPDDADTGNAILGVRRLLAAVVALFMFFNCLAWYKEEPVYLLLVTGAVVIDIVLQIVLRMKFRGGEEG
jgi:hypothetical protein